jgi:septal ring factor EnvC (AmiA/AmiB activator)
VAAISSIVQLIDFASKVVVRLDSIQSEVKESPDSLSSLKTELPVLLTTLQQIHNAIKDARMPPKSATALPSTIESCKKSIEEIDATLSKFCHHKVTKKPKLSSNH